MKNLKMLDHWQLLVGVLGLAVLALVWWQHNRGAETTNKRVPEHQNQKAIPLFTATMNKEPVFPGRCGRAVTVSVAGITAYDSITWAFNAPPSNPDLMLMVWATLGTANFKYCNPTGKTIRPKAETLNWTFGVDGPDLNSRIVR